MTTARINRSIPVGAEIVEGGVHFRVWAFDKKKLAVVIESGPPGKRFVELEPEQEGYFSGFVENTGEGAQYRYRIDGGEQFFPDPASRYQPRGPHGPSQVVNNRNFHWTDGAWPGLTIRRQIFYEMHVGTFTREGTWQSALRELPRLADLGITAIEVMPIGEFPGEFGWGYDGVDIFAPMHVYGTPDEVQRFVNEAHRLGIGVLLDVVYNHFGPDGNYLRQFSDYYFNDHHATEWGQAINYDGENARGVREFIVSNACYWIEEFHFDGLRIDAAQSIFDDSQEHILSEINRRARQAAGKRSILLIAENETQNTIILRPVSAGGYGFDALWNDDFHHSAMVAATGRSEAYYRDYNGSPQEFISCLKWGFLFQGQRYAWQKQLRGTPSFGLPYRAFVHYIQNHDQIANSAHGWRFHMLTSPGRSRALTALLLLSPQTPLLFQGQEFGAQTPFVYFIDHNDGALVESIHEGRQKYLEQFPSIASEEMRGYLPVPSARETFESCKLPAVTGSDSAQVSLHRDLIGLRRNDPVINGTDLAGVDGEVIGNESFIIRYFSNNNNDRILLVNFGSDLSLSVIPMPLFSALPHAAWKVLWSSEHPRYGGSGTPPVDTGTHWHIPGHAALLLSPEKT